MLQADQESSPQDGAIDALVKSTFRLIMDAPRDGSENMAIDEALMESAAKPEALPVFRFYGFRPPALSVGRFQVTENVFDFESLQRDEIGFVRRPSGGQAVLHDFELTYSVTAGRHIYNALSKRGFYRFVVPVLLAGLKQLMISGSAAEGGGGNDNPDCFAATGEYEIKSDIGKKLIGSAQMVSRGAVLQHGSIPLGPANRRIHAYIFKAAGENASSSLAEEIGRPVSFDTAAHAFSNAVSHTLKTVPSRLTEEESARATELMSRRYQTDEWNRKY